MSHAELNNGIGHVFNVGIYTQGNSLIFSENMYFFIERVKCDKSIRFGTMGQRRDDDEK